MYAICITKNFAPGGIFAPLDDLIDIGQIQRIEIKEPAISRATAPVYTT
jgi:hypothetical protein